MPAGKKAKTKKVSNTKKSTLSLNRKNQALKRKSFLIGFWNINIADTQYFGLAGAVGVGIKWHEFGLIGS